MKLAIFDIDGTITRHSMERLFIRYLLKTGLISPWHIMKSAIEYMQREPAGVRHGFKRNKMYLKGFDVLMIRQMATLCFESMIKSTIRPSLQTELEKQRSEGYKILLLSGSLETLTEKMMVHLQADFHIGTRVAESGGKYTGEIQGLHPYGRGKKTIAENFCKSNGFRLDEAVAYGNDYADAFLLSATKNPVAVDPDKQLRQWAIRKNWRMIG